MNFTLRPSLVLLFCFGMMAFSFSQVKHDPNSLKHVEYFDDIDDPLTKKELAFIKEVYGNHTQTDILNKPQRLKDIKNILRNRVVIQHLPNKNLSNFTPLSTISLFDTYNKSLVRDVIFEEEKFNPLKYKFNFDSNNETKTFRFDGTQYLIVIKSQHPQY